MLSNSTLSDHSSQLIENHFHINDMHSQQRNIPMESIDSFTDNFDTNIMNDISDKIYAWEKDEYKHNHLLEIIKCCDQEDFKVIFDVIIMHVVELVIDPFGNLLIQKLFDVGDEHQRLLMICSISATSHQLLSICRNKYGSSVVQSIIRHLEHEEEHFIIVPMQSITTTLMMDIYARHVIICCLQNFLPTHSKFILDAVLDHFMELATDNIDKMTFLKCFEYSDQSQTHQILSKIVSNAIFLSQHVFGNHLVNYALKEGTKKVRSDIIKQFDGRYFELSVGKYSSYVVQKCLIISNPEEFVEIISELLDRFSEILQNEYGNYVIQSAYDLSKGVVRNVIVEFAVENQDTICCSPHGREVLKKLNCLHPATVALLLWKI